ncbi:MAG: hypothetical protein A3C55_03970 [Gammaproteobacteria bacterium RIFCSPHIGHO2_02_FULL_42_13]|nr:MAG: hypothetical protein A3C55_03970 [Gammaproteobacteria bacterium RIFCSPHIGHO2_02_FULL_42_13]
MECIVDDAAMAVPSAKTAALITATLNFLFMLVASLPLFFSSLYILLAWLTGHCHTNEDIFCVFL